MCKFFQIVGSSGGSDPDGVDDGGIHIMVDMADTDGNGILEEVFKFFQTSEVSKGKLI